MTQTMTESGVRAELKSVAGRAGEARGALAGDPLAPTDTFVHRHVGPSEGEVAEMLALLGYDDLDAFTRAVVPASIRTTRGLSVGPERGEHELLAEFGAIAAKNVVMRSCIGMGYHGTVTPPVIQRNILENPRWYTQYTPYQAEISQGRLEALLNFQTMIADLTGLDVAGASLLDEGTAAAEAMAMCHAGGGDARTRFLVASDCHPQTIEVVKTRAWSMRLVVEVVTPDEMRRVLSGGNAGDVCGVLVQYPNTFGVVDCYKQLGEAAHAAGAMLVAACDPLALTLLTPPGEWGADIAIGSAQRFGVPMGFGGPHAAYIACREAHVRKMPGRIIGVSRDAQGHTAYRMALQTREQHIRREKATSNICTAQALLAIMASMYGVYHGPDGLRAIARRVRHMTQALRAGLLSLGHAIDEDLVFDSLRVRVKGSSASVLNAARERGINLRDFGDGTLGVTLDETSDRTLLADLLIAFGMPERDAVSKLDGFVGGARLDIPSVFERASAFMTHPVFNTHHSETEMLRYISTLQDRDLSLADSMIALGSCTMKLNATSEMLPVTWPELANIHPFAPREQTRGYAEMIAKLEEWLGDITGFPAVSLQPNAGSQGEYAGLLAIRAYHESRNESQRDVCLIPTSAHGTNPASAIIAGFRVVPVACDDMGNIDIADLRAKAEQHAANLGAIMVTYPSTHGVFEDTIRDVCAIVHEHGGQVYMDGANMNAQVGLCSPGEIGADVCHLNLHKTFCIPHGGGGPGMGPIGVAAHLAPFVPGHPVVRPADVLEEARRARGVTGVGAHGIGPVSAAPFGSALILAISYVYIALMGSAGLRRATQVAILNANYMAKRLEKHYNVLYRGPGGLVAHEFILDCRAFDKSAGVKIDDIAKRLIDYGFHAPTMSWPVPGTLMVEPTESEPKSELDRFCDALIAIRAEIAEVERGELPKDDNPLKHAPHTIAMVSANEWTHAYPREQAAYPAPWLRQRKFWAHVARVDNPFGDRNLVCACPPMEAYSA
ncbi:MAG: aminomethyl-transferring glycine dehydrogenase [Phycisphaerales bacterium]|jgi:glycine dehydrogenase|nr:aminomethyl-transferring glycine dehydrogenase [Phycisphaerales bacterium]